MGIKIYSYKDPFYINKYSFWKEVKDAPHLCVSQTLVQGLIKKYNRNEFNYLFCIDTVIEKLYEDWFKNTETRIKQYIKISEQISNIQDEKIKRSFKFNQNKVLDAIRMIKELDLDLNIDEGRLTKEQRIFINDILKNVEREDCFTIVDKSKTIKKRDILKVFNSLIKKDIEELEVRYEETGSKKIKEDKDYLEKVKSRENNLDKIVIHGVHRFDSRLFYFIKSIENLGIDIIFLINYDDEYKRIYETWDSVYKWTNKEITTEDISIEGEPQDIGIAIGKVLEGELKDVNECYLNLYKINVFDNLTSFSNSICKEYDEVLKKSKKRLKEGELLQANETLRNMSKQYYATNNKYINDVLKTYYPDQFGEKNFLSYPIGQFILSIYNMWDSKKNKLKINDQAIRECLIPIFNNTEKDSSIIEIYDKVKIYFKNKEYIDEAIILLKKLKSSISQINRNDEYKNLKKLSFYTVTEEDVSCLINTFVGLREIANVIFGETVNRDKISYSKHYKKLLDIITSKIGSSDDISKKEKEFIEEISEKLSTIDDEEIVGSIEDINQTLHFYLNTQSKDEHLKWIVRNFEQVDGGVLLSEDNSNKIYHYCFVSDKMMNPSINELLPWPININMLEKLNVDNKYLDAVVTSLKEYKNFLRYSLFYACIFCRSDVEISYVKDCGGEEEQSLYFILEILGIKKEKDNLDDNDKVGFREKRVNISKKLDNFINPSRVELEKAEICTYRYLLDHVIDETMYFSNEYQIKYYIIVMLFSEVVSKLSTIDSSKVKEDIIDSEVSRVRDKYMRYLPCLSEVDKIDIMSKVKKDVINHIESCDVELDQDYLDKKLEFLMASIKDTKNNEEENLIKGIFKSDLSNKKIVNYLLNNKIKDEEINPLVCEYCAQREVCLEPFKVV